MAKKPHARVNFPSNFKKQTPLVEALIAYKAGLPVNNWIAALEVAVGRTLASVQTIANNAKVFDLAKDANHKLSMNEVEARDKILIPLVTRMEGGFQVIKAINKPDLAPIRLWGAVVTTGGRVEVPTDKVAQVAMFKLYSDKYATFAPGNAPIEFYQVKHGYIMATDALAAIASGIHNTSAIALQALSEDETEQRNTIWEPGLEFLVKVYNVGKATYADFFRELGIMGFDIAESAPTHKDQISTALQGAQVLVHGAIIGSVVENLENFDVLLHPGEILAKPPIILHANTITAVKKGMSSFIFENPDPTHIAKIRSTVRRSR